MSHWTKIVVLPLLLLSINSHAKEPVEYTERDLQWVALESDGGLPDVQAWRLNLKFKGDAEIYYLTFGAAGAPVTRDNNGARASHRSYGDPLLLYKMIVDGYGFRFTGGAIVLTKGIPNNKSYRQALQAKP